MLGTKWKGAAAACAMLWAVPAAADPLGLVGTWQVKETLVQTTCANTVGSVTSAQWNINWAGDRYKAVISGTTTNFPTPAEKDPHPAGAKLTLTQAINPGKDDNAVSAWDLVLEDGALRGQRLVASAVPTKGTASCVGCIATTYTHACATVRHVEATRAGATPASAMPF